MMSCGILEDLPECEFFPEVQLRDRGIEKYQGIRGNDEARTVGHGIYEGRIFPGT